MLALLLLAMLDPVSVSRGGAVGRALEVDLRGCEGVGAGLWTRTTAFAPGGTDGCFTLCFNSIRRRAAVFN